MTESDTADQTTRDTTAEDQGADEAEMKIETEDKVRADTENEAAETNTEDAVASSTETALEEIVAEFGEGIHSDENAATSTEAAVRSSDAAADEEEGGEPDLIMVAEGETGKMEGIMATATGNILDIRESATTTEAHASSTASSTETVSSIRYPVSGMEDDDGTLFDAVSSDAASIPENATGTPENATGTPENATGTPENATGTPENATGTPESESGVQSAATEYELKAEILAELETALRAEYEKKLEKLETLLEEKSDADAVSETRGVRENLQSKLDFGDDECTQLSLDELYCVREGAHFEPISPPSFRGVFARDDGLDHEIVFQKGGRTFAVTNNDYDDILPFYDDRSGFIAWQALINDRWQIMVHDLALGVTEQITDTASNNSNPRIYNGDIVWQGWGDTHWEIFYAYKKGKTSPADTAPAVPWTVRRITENDWHDIGPSIAGEFILWEAYKDGAWHVFGHHVASGETFQISEGKGKNVNPRLAVLWDSIEDGSRELLQYDLALGTTSKVPRSGEEGGEKKRPVLPAANPTEKEATIPSSYDARGTTSASGRPDDDGGE